MELKSNSFLTVTYLPAIHPVNIFITIILQMVSYIDTIQRKMSGWNFLTVIATNQLY